MAVDIEPKVGSIVRHTIEPKATWMAIIIVISVEIIANTEDIIDLYLDQTCSYRFLPLMIATNPNKLSLVAIEP